MIGKPLPAGWELVRGVQGRPVMFAGDLILRHTGDPTRRMIYSPTGQNPNSEYKFIPNLTTPFFARNSKDPT